MKNLKIKTGDIVKVIAGKDKGKTGKILQTFPVLNRVVVEGINISKRHLRTRRQGEKGQIIEFSMPIHASNVLPIADNGKVLRHKSANSKRAVSESKAHGAKKTKE